MALVGTVVFLDTVFYAVIAPLLPGLTHQLHLSRLSAGVLTGSYALGTLVGSLPSGMLASRLGPRPTVLLGLGLLASSTLAFALLRQPVTLDLARAAEGVGGACSWAGGLAWMVGEAPAERRGALIGQAMAAAVVGTLFGPALGGIAGAVGRPAAFSLVAAGAAVLAAVVAGTPTAHIAGRQGMREVAAAVRAPRAGVAMWLVAVPALLGGALSLIGPLRLHRFGAGVGAITAVFMVAAAVEAVISPWVGRISDRHGRVAPMAAGLVVAAGLLLLFGLPTATLPLAALIVGLAGSEGAFWAPAMAMLSEVAESTGLDQGLAAALTNVAWAGGQVIGSSAGGAIAKATSDAVPMVIVAALCVATLPALARAGVAVQPGALDPGTVEPEAPRPGVAAERGAPRRRESV